MSKLQKKYSKQRLKLHSAGFLMLELILVLSVVMIFVLATLQSVQQVHNVSLKINQVYDNFYRNKNQTVQGHCTQELDHAIQLSINSGL